jgi:hypothetical protein
VSRRWATRISLSGWRRLAMTVTASASASAVLTAKWRQVFGLFDHRLELGLGEVEDVQGGAGGHGDPAGRLHEGGGVADPLADGGDAADAFRGRELDAHLARNDADHADRRVAGVVETFARLEGSQAAAADDLFAEGGGATGQPAVALHHTECVFPGGGCDGHPVSVS